MHLVSRFFWLTALLSACTQRHCSAASDPDKLLVQTGETSSESLRVPGWRQSLTLPLRQKLSAAPREIVRFVEDDNRKKGWPDVPRSVVPDAAWQRDYATAIDTLPVHLQELVNAGLLGVYTVSHLGGSAYTESLTTLDGQFAGAFIVVDLSVLNRTANEWANWKERSPFHASVALDAVIEDPAGDTRANALQYILLHELGHVVSVARRGLPKWDTTTDAVLVQAPYAALSWTVRDGHAVGRSDDVFPSRRNVHYYASTERQLPGGAVSSVYDGLIQTGFPTLYAATNVFDDFADSFANYVHTVVLQRPWRIVLHDAGSSDRVIKPCWDEPRCAAKRAFFDGWLR